MKNLTKLGFILSVGTVAAFSIGGCSDDTGTTTTTPTAGMSAGGSSAGTTTTTGGAGTTSTGGSSAGTVATGGGGAATGGGGAATGGGGAATGGGGSGGKAGSGGGGTGGTGGSGGASGSGGSGGAASAGCMKACMGADSINTICAGETIPDTIKNMCLASCAKATEAQVTCWNMHAGFAKAATGADKTMHCGHATGAAPCSAWPAP